MGITGMGIIDLNVKTHKRRKRAGEGWERKNILEGY